MSVCPNSRAIHCWTPPGLNKTKDSGATNLGERKKIAYGDGIMGAPEFSLDDNSIIFTASISGNIDLYK